MKTLLAVWRYLVCDWHRYHRYHLPVLSGGWYHIGQVGGDIIVITIGAEYVRFWRNYTRDLRQAQKELSF